MKLYKEFCVYHRYDLSHFQEVMIVEQVKGKNSDVDMIRSDEEDRKKSS